MPATEPLCVAHTPGLIGAAALVSTRMSERQDLTEASATSKNYSESLNLNGNPTALNRLESSESLQEYSNDRAHQTRAAYDTGTPPRHSDLIGRAFQARSLEQEAAEQDTLARFGVGMASAVAAEPAYPAPVGSSSTPGGDFGGLAHFPSGAAGERGNFDVDTVKGRPQGRSLSDDNLILHGIPVPVLGEMHLASGSEAGESENTFGADAIDIPATNGQAPPPDQCWDMMDASQLFFGSSPISDAIQARQQQQHQAMEAWLSQQDPADDSQPSRHMWLGNLNPRLPRQALREVLQEYGVLDDIVTFPGRMYAFANFRSAEDAQAVAVNLANKIVPRLTARRKLIVRFRPSRKAVGKQVADVIQAAKEDEDETIVFDSPITYHEHLSLSIPKMLAMSASSSSLSQASSMPSQSLPELPEDLGSPLSVCGIPGAPVGPGTDSGAVRLTPPAAPGTPPQIADMPTRHLWFGNVPPKPSRTAMEECFSAFGRLESLRVFPGKTYAFVNFVSVQDAARAKAALDGVPIPGITGTRPMIMRFQPESNAAAAAARQESKNVTRVTLTSSSSGGSLLDPRESIAAAQARAQAKLSNRLNPNNIYFDPILAEQYKRMSKLEKELLWHFDRSNRVWPSPEPQHSAGFGSLQTAADFSSQMVGALANAGFQQPPHARPLGAGLAAPINGPYIDSPYDAHGGDAALWLLSGLSRGAGGANASLNPDNSILDPTPSLNWGALGNMDGNETVVPSLAPMGHASSDSAVAHMTQFAHRQQGHSSINPSESIIADATFSSTGMPSLMQQQLGRLDSVAIADGGLPTGKNEPAFSNDADSLQGTLARLVVGDTATVPTVLPSSKPGLTSMPFGNHCSHLLHADTSVFQQQQLLHEDFSTTWPPMGSNGFNNQAIPSMRN